MKAFDLVNCVILNKYEELAEKYGLNQETLMELQWALKRGKWRVA
jgi:hypothetical protein